MELFSNWLFTGMEASDLGCRSDRRSFMKWNSIFAAATTLSEVGHICIPPDAFSGWIFDITITSNIQEKFGRKLYTENWIDQSDQK